MKVVATDYAAAAALLHIYGTGISDFDDSVHSFTVERLSGRLCETVSPEFDIPRTQKIVDVLAIIGVGQFYRDPFAEQVFQVSDGQIQSFFTARARTNDVFARTWNLGLDWVKTAFTKEKFWVEFDKEPLEFVSVMAPTDNGHWALDHNSSSFEDARDALDKLLNSLGESNDLGDLSTDDLDAVRREVKEIRQELDGEQVMLPEFGNRARLVLGWIAKEAAGAAIGALAIAAFIALTRMLTVPF